MPSLIYKNTTKNIITNITTTISSIGIQNRIKQDIVINIVIAVSLFATFLVLPLVAMYCKKTCARRKVKKFQRKRKLRHQTTTYDVTSDQIIARHVLDCPEVDRDTYDVITSDCSGGKQKNGSEIVTSSSQNNETNSGIFLENFAYGDCISSFATNSNISVYSNDNREFKKVRSDSGYENLSKKRRRRHAYETIACEGNVVKIIENNLPVPIQIKRQSRSEDVTIFPHVIQHGANKGSSKETPTLMGEQSDVKGVNVPKQTKTLQNTPRQTGTNPKQNQATDTVPNPTKNPVTETISNTGLHLPADIQTTSPYAVQTTPLRCKRRPNMALLHTSAMVQSNNTTSPYLERTWSAPNRHQTWAEAIESQNQIKSECVEVEDRSFKNLTTQFPVKSENVKINEPKNRTTSRRQNTRIHRRKMKRKKRRVLDERRARLTGKQNHDQTLDTTLDNKSQSRWPLKKMFYFGSSSDSSGDIFRFRSLATRKSGTGSTGREASLLEDIWFHLDGMAAKSQQKKDLTSENQGSISLSSSSENLQQKQRITPGTIGDRGYFTYKEQDFDHQGALEISNWRKNDVTTEPRGPHIGNVTKVLESREQRSRRKYFRGIRPAVPNVLRSSLRHDVIEISDVTTSMTDDTSYLNVLDCYLSRESIYEKLSNCVSVSKNSKNFNNLNSIDDSNLNFNQFIITNDVSTDDVASNLPVAEPTDQLQIGKSPILYNISIPRLFTPNFSSNSFIQMQSTPRGFSNKSVIIKTSTKNYVVILPSVLLRKNKPILNENLYSISSHASLASPSEEVVSPQGGDSDDNNLSVFMEMSV